MSLARFIPQSSDILIPDNLGSIHIYNQVSGQKVSTLCGHEDIVTDAVFVPTEMKLLSGSMDGTVSIWDLERQVLLKQLLDIQAPISSMRFSPDGKHLLLCSADEVRVLHNNDWQTAHLFDGYSPLTIADFASDSESLIIGDFHGYIEIRSMVSGEAIHGSNSHSQPIVNIVAQVEANAAYIWNHTEVFKWDFKDDMIITLGLDQEDVREYGIIAGSISNNGRVLGLANGLGDIVVIEIPSLKRLSKIQVYHDDVHSIDFDDDGCRLLIRGDQPVRLWDIDANEQIRVFPAQ